MSSDHLPFAIVPVEAILDARLTRTQLRVLVAILSFRSRDTGVAFPKRSSIAARTGIAETRISQTTTELVNLSWIEKDGDGRFGRPCTYRVTTPKALTEAAITACSQVTEPVTLRVTEPVTHGLRNPLPSEGYETRNPQRTDQEQTIRTDQDGFDRFWSVYPRKVKKEDASKIWQRKKLEPLSDMIVADVTRRRLDDVQWSDKKYIPYPTTYLNGKGWTDEILTKQPGARNARKNRHDAAQQLREMYEAGAGIARSERTDERVVFEVPECVGDEVVGVLPKH